MTDPNIYRPQLETREMVMDYDPRNLHRGPIFDMERLIQGIEDEEVTYADVFMFIHPNAAEIPISEYRNPYHYIHTDYGLGDYIQGQEEFLRRVFAGREEQLDPLLGAIQSSTQNIVDLMNASHLNSRDQATKGTQVKKWLMKMRDEGIDPFEEYIERVHDLFDLTETLIEPRVLIIYSEVMVESLSPFVERLSNRKALPSQRFNHSIPATCMNDQMEGLMACKVRAYKRLGLEPPSVFGPSARWGVNGSHSVKLIPNFDLSKHLH